MMQRVMERKLESYGRGREFWKAVLKQHLKEGLARRKVCEKNAEREEKLEKNEGREENLE